MNAINRIGQRVVCVQPHDLWEDFCCTVSSFPIQGATYTVSGFGEIEGHPGIWLFEISGVTCECANPNLNDAPWPLACFRPVDERRTDISAFQALLDRVPAPA